MTEPNSNPKSETLKPRNRVYYKDNGPNDTGTVVFMSEDGKAALVQWDDGQYDCAETVLDNGQAYFGEWFNVGSLQKTGAKADE